jgi:hypothetical protein
MQTMMMLNSDLWSHVVEYLNNHEIYTCTLTLNQELYKVSFKSLLKTNHQFQQLCCSDYVDTVKQFLLDESIDPSFNDCICLQWACMFGSTSVVKELLRDGRVNVTCNDNHPIRWSSFFGHVDIVKLLLKDSKVDPCADNYFAIREAYVNGHLDVVDVLSQDDRVMNSCWQELPQVSQQQQECHKQSLPVEKHKISHQSTHHHDHSSCKFQVNTEEQCQRRKELREKIKYIRFIVTIVLVPVLVIVTMAFRYNMGYYR